LPCSLKANATFGAIVLRLKGACEFRELFDLIDKFLLLDGFAAGVALVADCRDGSMHLSAENIRQLADRAKGTDAAWGASKWAVLVSTDVMFGQVRMFQTLTHDHRVQTQVFRTAEEADEWLGLGIGTDRLLALTPA